MKLRAESWLKTMKEFRELNMYFVSVSQIYLVVKQVFPNYGKEQLVGYPIYFTFLWHFARPEIVKPLIEVV